MEKGAPWLKNYGNVPFNLEYPDGTMVATVLKTAEELPYDTALSFMGRRISYRALSDNIQLTAKAFAAAGVKSGDRVAVCLPNLPQTVFCLYALNLIGAVACMIHPLSAEGEIASMLKEADCSFAVALDQFAYKFQNLNSVSIIVTSAADGLGFIKSTAFKLTKGRKYKKGIPEGAVLWKGFIKGGYRFKEEYAVNRNACDVAVILFSGGTTGVTKAF